MKEKSYLIFVKHLPRGYVYEIRSLDPFFRIREMVHTGNLEKTGYAIQVFVKNEEQKRTIVEYMKLRKIKECLYIVDDYASVLNIESGMCSSYNQVHYYDSVFQEDKHLGYSIHIEDSRYIGNIPFFILGIFKNSHPELNSISNGKYTIKLK